MCGLLEASDALLICKWRFNPWCSRLLATQALFSGGPKVNNGFVLELGIFDDLIASRDPELPCHWFEETEELAIMQVVELGIERLLLSNDERARVNRELVQGAPVFPFSHMVACGW